ncbi:hypothetical protein ACMHYJ_01430 [Castellaniella hirudinis]|uniref:hypothetical protein n=1 Tax=Castellaniella hirudinis TaxID=1144617 RepID=UPI0039C320FF
MTFGRLNKKSRPRRCMFSLRPHCVIYRPEADDQRAAGVYRRNVMLAGGRDAMLNDGIGFSLGAGAV